MHPRAAIRRYLEAGLPPRSEARLRRHLRACAHCRADYDDHVALLRALTAQPDRPTVAETERVVARAVAAVAPPTTVAAPARRGWEHWLARLIDGLLWSPQHVAVATAAVLVLVVGAPWWLTQQSPAATLVRGTNVTVDGKALPEGAHVRRGKTLAVAADGIAELKLVRGGTLRVFPGTQLELGRRGQQVRLPDGKIWCVVDGGQGTFIVRTPSSETQVLGTSFVVEHDGDREETEVRVMNGRVQVADRDDQGAVEVEGGYQTRVRKGTAPAAPTRYDSRQDRFDWDRFLRQLWEDFKDAVRDIQGDLKELMESSPTPKENR